MTKMKNVHMQKIHGTIYTDNLGNNSDEENAAIAAKMVEIAKEQYPVAEIDIDIIDDVGGAVHTQIFWDCSNSIGAEISDHIYQLAIECF